jgi:hypothetical protein
MASPFPSRNQTRNASHSEKPGREDASVFFDATFEQTKMIWIGWVHSLI